MSTTITLAQFERVDGLLAEVLRRPALERLMEDPAAARRLYFMPEWKLFDALVETFGYAASEAYSGAEEWATEVVTHALMSASFVEAA